ncbi:MAG: MFS transporter [Clostridiales bacterium]|nr:MFS transporter [Clostridiales bacterium]
MKSKLMNMRKEMLLYLLIIAFGALGNALISNVLSNYLKDVYAITAYQRGVIEFPRELPGLFSIFIVSALSMYSDIRIAMFAQFLAATGILFLGLFTPIYGLMLVLIFVNSMGAHLYMPMSQSIGISLIKDGKFGKGLGQYNGLITAFQMSGAIIVLIGFKYHFLSFETPIKYIFVVAAFFLFATVILLFYLDRRMHHPDIHHNKEKFVFRKAYKYYYTLVIMFGVQKQMMIVYGPWMLIELLGVKVDTLAILAIIGYFIGIFFIPALGRWLDRFGVKKLLYADALSFIIVYALYGFLSAGFTTGTLATAGISVFLAYGLFIIDRMSTQMGIIRTVYLKKIAIDSRDITPTLSLGMTMDHFISIIAAFLGGIVWVKWGPQYIFYLVSLLSFVNLYVAYKVEITD